MNVCISQSLPNSHTTLTKQHSQMLRGNTRKIKIRKSRIKKSKIQLSSLFLFLQVPRKYRYTLDTYRKIKFVNIKNKKRLQYNANGIKNTFIAQNGFITLHDIWITIIQETLFPKHQNPLYSKLYVNQIRQIRYQRGGLMPN